MEAANLRQMTTELGHPGAHLDPDLIQREIRRLVVERQELRVAEASDTVLERNRLEIARLQRELARVLVEAYLPQRGASAA
jgi:hypothetical protein